MKKFLLPLVLFAGLSLQAQEKYEPSRNYNLAFSYQYLQQKSFGGIELDYAIKLWRKKDHLDLGVGIQSGLWLTSIQKEVSHQTEFYNPVIPADVEGTLYCIPVSVYFLAGRREDFLDIGADAQLLQFNGTKEFDYENEHYTYKFREFTPIASLHIGYRHQPIQGGIYFRVLWLPCYEVLNDTFYSSYRVSLGYSF